MPGLKQLKEFSKEIRTLGNEPSIRRKRGEVVPKIKLPSGVRETDDSDDFLLGLPLENQEKQTPKADLAAEENPNPNSQNIDYDALAADLFNTTGDTENDVENLLSNVYPSNEKKPLDLNEAPNKEDVAQETEDDTIAFTDKDFFDFSDDEENVENQDAQRNENTIPSIIEDTPDPENENSSEESNLVDDTPDIEIPIQDANADTKTILEEAEKTNQIEQNEIPATQEPVDDDLESLIFGDNQKPINLSDLPEFSSDAIPDDPDFEADEAETEKQTADDENNDSAPIEPSADEDAIPKTESPDADEEIFAEETEPEPDFGFSSLADEAETEKQTATDENNDSAPTEPIADENAIPKTESPDADEEIFAEETEPEPDFGFSSLADEAETEKQTADDENNDSAPIEPISDEDAILETEPSDVDEEIFAEETDKDIESEDSVSELADDESDEDNDLLQSFEDNIEVEASTEQDTIPATDKESAINSEEKKASLGPIAESFDLDAEKLIDKFNFSDDNFFDTSEDHANEAFGEDARPIIDDDGFSAKNDLISEDDYALFLKNLNYYPLNLRVEIEKLIVGNEYTEEVVSNLFKLILKKVSAANLADYVGNLLEITIDVPRNYEKRTAAQYEAYKSSASYQLKSRIIPVTVFIVLLACAGWFTAKIVNKFIIRPIIAEKNYREGYALLENNFFPQADLKFLDGLSYNPSKKWFFAYARGYREKKQFDRARQMYERSLLYYGHDKRFGLEYAGMELYDLSNFEKAENIVRRKVLDNFVNDKDGILLLGDIFLEWATESDPQKFELARAQYALLLELFGSSDLYLSRMMRYFIRTDNLREVLPLKSYFLAPEKILEPKDLVELSGYLLDKQYGVLNPSDEYLRQYIEDVRLLLERAVTADSSSADAQYNLARYFVETKNRNFTERQLAFTLKTFENAKVRTRKSMLKNIDTYRMLGEYYVSNAEYLQAEEQFINGLLMYENEAAGNDVKPDKNIGKLYEDMANFDYFVSGDLNQALRNYQNALQTYNDTPLIHYKIGYIQYGNNDFQPALNSFITAVADKPDDVNVLLALANTLYLRENTYAAQGYYEQLLNLLNAEKERSGAIFPQTRPDQAELVENYMRATNNYGVTLNKIALRTGDSSKNAQAMVLLSESTRAWDALTRNQETMVRLDGSNLAAQNIKYISSPRKTFDPEIYIDIPRTIRGEIYYVK